MASWSFIHVAALGGAARSLPSPTHPRCTIPDLSLSRPSFLVVADRKRGEWRGEVGIVANEINPLMQQLLQLLQVLCLRLRLEHGRGHFADVSLEPIIRRVAGVDPRVELAFGHPRSQ